LFASIGHSINNIILCHRANLETKRETRSALLKLEPRWLEATSTAAGPKTRWVDGTPEYSFHIYGLRRLFPQALFIHLFRDVRAVVRSMVNFHRVAGIHLVANEEEAYRYWTRTVRACLMAERAYGPNVVYRLRYAHLINNPEFAMRSVLGFLKENYTDKCLEPLELRINSSHVSAEPETNDAATDPVVVKEAMQLSAEVEQTPQPAQASSVAADEMEAAFRARVNYVASIDHAYQEARRLIETLNKSGLPLHSMTEAIPPISDSSAAVLSRQP
jgi:sulfotransferase family protein